MGAEALVDLALPPLSQRPVAKNRFHQMSSAVVGRVNRLRIGPSEAASATGRTWGELLPVAGASPQPAFQP